jgi:PAS domain S-box-containing protein
VVLKQRLFRSPLFGYLIALVGISAAVAVTLLISKVTALGPAIGLLFVAAILGAAWTGYGPGIVATVITFVAIPYLFRPAFTFSSIQFSQFLPTLIASVLMSSVAHGRRSLERQLRSSNQQLDAGIRTRTVELEQARQRLTNILESLTSGFLALDRNGRFLYANELVARAAGLTQEGITGKDIWGLFPDARKDEFYAAYRRVMDERVPVQFEAEYEERWYDVHANPTEEGLTAYVVDVSERHAFQQKLIASHGQLMDVLESITDAFMAFDRQWHFLFVNQAAARLLRRPAEQIIGHTAWELFPQVVGTTVFDELQRAMTDRVAAHFEMNYGGTPGIWVEHHAYPTPEGLAVFSRDITARKQSDRALRRMASIIESSQDAIISKTLGGIVLTWNPAAERIYGYTSAEIVGQRMDILLPADRQLEEQEILNPARLQSEPERHFETIRLRKDGKLIHVSLTISPVFDENGVLIGVSHIARDISERVQIDEQLRQTQKLESLGVLAGGVAHDFNNLLTGILGNASLTLENAAVGSPNHIALSEVVTAAERAADLTRQLLAYAGKGRFVVGHVDLSALVRQITNLVRTSIPKHVQLRLQLTEPLPLIEADTSQMQQIIMNLVINGAEALGAEQGTVLIQTATQHVDEHYIATLAASRYHLQPGEYVVLEVHDTGCGMDSRTLGRIFDPFFTTKFTGRGLGLSAVLGIVSGHKGALKVYSTPGRGTTFKLLFPVARTGPTAAAAEETRSNLTGAGLILVVDDERLIRMTAKLALERYGYTVLLAENGQQAIEIFHERAGEIDLILMDLTMPVMGGEEAIRHLKVSNPAVRIILSSGFNEVEAIQRFTGKGLAGFIQKPYTAAALATKVKSVLDSTAENLRIR